jgi:hypothetical protein
MNIDTCIHAKVKSDRDGHGEITGYCTFYFALL